MKNRVAFVTESLFSMGGANRVLERFLEIYPQADIYALFGDKKKISKKLSKCNIKFSFLNRIPFINKSYRFTLMLWPLAIEQFDFSNYDLVISSSTGVAHGIITPLSCKHICYLHTPMRSAWDLKGIYKDSVRGVFKVFPFIAKFIYNVSLNFNRVWEVVASNRPEVIIANSNFVRDRAQKYWGRKIDYVIYPPVDEYKGKILLQKGDYFVAGAPFEPNKKGEFLLECAKSIGFNLKIIGQGHGKKKWKRRYRRCKNIEFLGGISDQEKWELLSRASGYICCGIEDFGIFPVEAMSCGCPVLAYKAGGVLESVSDGLSGMFFTDWSKEALGKAMKIFENKKWNYELISKYSKQFTSRDFAKEISNIVND